MLLPETRQPFPITSADEAAVFSMFGRLGPRTLQLAGRMHNWDPPQDSPARFLVDGYPLRPELRVSEAARDRYGYGLGVLVADVTVQTAMHSDARVHMPERPLDDAGIRRVQALSAGSRFWLQQFFSTSGDLLAELQNGVEMPLRQRGVDLGPLPNNGTNEQQGVDYFVVGAGDLLAVCAVVLGYKEYPSTLPLMRDLVS